MSTVLDVLATVVLACALWRIVPDLWARRRPEERLDCQVCSWSICFRSVTPESARYFRTLAGQHAATHNPDPDDDPKWMGESWIWAPGDRDDKNGEAR
ncbi:hypothetical protein ACFY04_30405 [Streptomyces sp. NPDC001549]|uniref:hypothetical protein n=1 Tax=Streptomyces sp. NPDC001549 TaxID=3364586 RepID=UPI003696F3B2